MNDRGKVRQLQEFARYLVDVLHTGALTGKPIQVQQVVLVPGPRAGAVELLVGLEVGCVLRRLTQADSAALRQLVPWEFPDDRVGAFMAGRYLRCEAAWPDDLAELVIPLDGLGQYPKEPGRWTVGKSERGAVIRPALCDATPHVLLAGQTGSGKSVALTGALLQLSHQEGAELVLVDGKGGESLRPLERLPGVIGPCAVELEEVRAALGWAVQELRMRRAGQRRRLIVACDEIQEVCQDDTSADLLRRIAATGRSRGVHLLAATQHPSIEAFGDASTRRNLTGRVALKVADYDASRVAVGASSPRADHLAGAGDAYVLTPGAVHRVQVAYVDERDIQARSNGRAWRFDEWPEFVAEDIGPELPTDKRRGAGWQYSGAEMAVALVTAMKGEGRPKLCRRLVEAGLDMPGAERAIRLLELGREQLAWMQERSDEGVCLSDSRAMHPLFGRDNAFGAA